VTALGFLHPSNGVWCAVGAHASGLSHSLSRVAKNLDQICQVLHCNFGRTKEQKQHIDSARNLRAYSTKHTPAQLRNHLYSHARFGGRVQKDLQAFAEM